MFFLTFLFCFNINLHIISGLNISLTTYHGLKLPLNLLNHISVIYDNHIYIIGGSKDNYEASSNIYKSEHPINTSDNRFVHIDTINVTLSVPFSLNIQQITCKNQCFTVIDNIMYIFIDYDNYIILLKYDLVSQLFVDLNEYSYFYNNGEEFLGGCVLNDNAGGYVYLLAADRKRIGLRYDTINDKWDMIYSNLNSYERHSMGCAIDEKKENIYIFGGIDPNNDVPLTDIQKYNIEREEISTLSDSMRYPRSNVFVEERKDHYFILYSDDVDIIEYFDANTDTILIYDTNTNDNRLFDVNLTINIRSFASFMADDVWFINGGVNHSEIKYVDTMRLFDVTIKQNTDIMSCSTVYAPDWTDTNLRDEYLIDSYLWQTNSRILFSAISSNIGIVRPSITIESSTVHYTLEYNFTNNRLLYLRAAYLRSNGGPLRDSKKRIYNVRYPSIMWSSWDMNQLCTGSDVAPSTYFRGGVGSVFDKFSSNYRMGYCFKPTDIVTVYFYDYHEISNTKWQFYHNFCSIEIDIFPNVFSIGDYIYINATLFRGTKVNTAIYITSDDMPDVNHSLFINETNHCIICNHLCRECQLGIQITDLVTYDIDKNSYKIMVHTDNNENNKLLDGSTVFEFSRNILNVNLTFHDIDGHLIDFSELDIYPTMQIYVKYGFNTIAPPQLKGSIIMEWDNDLNLGNIELQFVLNGSCLLILTETNTVNCSHPIVVPYNMVFKPIQQNYYSINVYSKDTRLNANIPPTISRKIQNISIVMSESVAVGAYVNITTHILDDKIYQTQTLFSLYSLVFDINVTIQITHKETECIIYHHKRKKHTLCSNGIGPIYPQKDVEFGVIYLNSNDTYLSIYQHKINIVKATLGLVFLDGNQQQILFEETPLYPGFHLYPNYYVDKLPVSPQASIYIEWDEALNIDNKECLINSTVCWSNPIIIPWNITYKSIYDNIYVFDVYSFDVALKGNAPQNKEWKRAIQNISIDVNKAVAVGGMMIIYISIQDDKIYQPFSSIDIYSDALEINHTMYISYNISADTPLITDCSIINLNTFNISPCNDGIGPIKPTNEANHFEIDMFSDDTYLVRDIFSVDIIRVPVDVSFHDGNHTDISFDEIYPGLNIYVSVQITDKTLPAPLNAIIYIEWDITLNIGDNDGISIIIMRFDEDECIIHLNTNYTMHCTEPIVVPYDMKYNDKGERNQYSFAVYSYDINLIRDYPKYLNRKIQSVVINATQNNIAVYQYIPIVIAVSDTQIYQPYSSITVKNDILGIESQILIEYDNDVDSFITNCSIKNYAHNKNVECDVGLGQIFPQQLMDDNVMIIELNSDNTNIVQDISIQVDRMQVNVTFYDENENIIYLNETYPGMEIFIGVDYDETAKIQNESAIFIDWDQDLHLGGAAAMHILFIDFVQDECYITFGDADGDDQSCNEAIIIPINMTYKIIKDNYYDFDVYSFDTELISSAPPFIKRKIQTVDVVFPDSIALGSYISVSISIVDDMIVQPTSTIYVESDELQIDSTIFVEYKNIINCTVLNHYSDTIESCKKGIGPILSKSSNIKLKDFVSLSSEDTILKNQVTQIPIITGKAVDYNDWITGDYCPIDYCCQHIEGCLYFDEDSYNAYLCAHNRNHTVPLCGSCNIGYAQVFNSPNCKICDTDHWEYLLLPLCVAFIVTFIIVSFDTTNDNDNDPTRQQRMRRDESEGISILLFRISILFYQMINYILWQIGYSFWATIIVQILSLDSYLWFSILPQYTFSEGNDGVCFLQNLNGMQYYGWYLYFPGALLFTLIMYALCKSSYINNKKKYGFGDYTVWNVALIALFPVLTVLMIMLSCKYIDNTYGTVHFYAGETQCYGTEFIVASVLLLVIITFFGVSWLYLACLGSSARQRKRYILKGIILPYKADWWFWEFILLIRRLLVIIFITLQYFGKTGIYITMLIILFLFAIIEFKCNPWRYTRALYMDLLCMIALMICLIAMILNIDNVILISIVILFPLLLLLWYIMDSIWACNSRAIHRRGSSNRMEKRIQKMEQRLRWIGVDVLADEGQSPLVYQSSITKHRTRDTTLSAIIEAECEESRTYKTEDEFGSKTKSRLLFVSRKKSSKKHKYQEIINQQICNNQNNIIEESDDDDGESTESTTYSTRKRHMHNTKMDTEMVTWNNDEEEYGDKNKKPFVRRTKLPQTKSPLTVIQENPDKKEDSQSDKNHSDVDQSSVDDDTYASRNDFGVVIADDSAPFISSGFSMQYTATHKHTNHQPTRLGATTEQSFNHTETTRDGYISTSNDDDITATDLTSDGIYSNDTVHPAKIEERMQVISKPQMTQNMQNILGSTDESSDSDHTFDQKEHEVPSHRKSKHVPTDDDDDDEDGAKRKKQQKTPPPAPKRVFVKPQAPPRTRGMDEETPKQSYSSERGSITPFQTTPFVAQDKEDSDSDKESTLDDMLNAVLSAETPITNTQDYLYEEDQDIDVQFDDDTKEQYKYEQRKVKVPLKLHRSASSLNTIEEDRKLDEIGEIRLTIDEEEDRINTPQYVNSLQNHPSQRFQYDHLHIDMEPMQKVSSHTSFRCESPVVLAPTKSHGLQNQSAIEDGYKYEYVHHEQSKEKERHVLRTSTLKDIAINSDSYSDASTTISSEIGRVSWLEYRQNLKRLFYLFAGYQRWSKKKGIYMSPNEVKRFLQIVEITKYWDVDQVFKQMDNDIIDKKVTLNEFIEYFCDEENNPKANDIKKHIEKQISWQLLLKALRIFDKIDVDRSGKLEYNEFVQFGKMLNLDDKETQILWKKIDQDQNGQITIVELFEWFRERLEAARQNKKQKKANARDFSRSHSSFDDSTTQTK